MLAATLASPSLAAADGAMAALRYHAPRGCPSARSFRAQVEARLSPEHLADSRDVARRYAVTLAASDAGFGGRLEGVDDHGAAVSQSLAAPSCSELAGALALVTALAIDPAASTERLPDPPAEPPEEPAPTLPPPLAERKWTSSAAAQALLATAVAPGVSPGAGAFFELGRVGRSAVAPSARLGVEAAAGSAGIPGGGRAVYHWAAGRLEVCPLRWTLTRGLWTGPCAGAALGWVSASGRDLPIERTQGSVLLDLEATARLRAEWLSPVFFELDATFLVPTSHPSFTVGSPQTTAHEVAPVGAFVALGAGVRFF